jgi:SAM-dependent methyltransferase
MTSTQAPSTGSSHGGSTHGGLAALGNLAGDLVHDTVAAIARTEFSPDTTSQDRYMLWRWTQVTDVVEYLIPRLPRAIGRTWPAYMDTTPGHRDIPDDELARQVKELGPWFVPFRLRRGLATVDLKSKLGGENVDKYLFRRDLITGTVADLLGDDLDASTVLDIGCNSGYFSLDLAARGAAHVDGFDLREENIARARFVAEHYGLTNVDFRVADAETLGADEQWDVVLNLGLLYHLTNPLDVLRRTYELCRRFAIIDTVCHTEPVAAFFLFGDKDTDHPAEGRERWEFHPTYRGAVEAIRFAGFSEVVELVAVTDRPHPLYESGNRRCFLAVK